MTQTPRIALAQLQQKHPGKIVALNQQETTIIAVANTFPALINKLNRQHINPQNCVYIGPIPQSGTIEII